MAKGLGGLFGRGSIGEQLFVWGLLSQVVQALTMPGIIELQQTSQAAFPNVALSPAELATLVNRHFMTMAAAADQAKLSGVDAGRLAHLVQLAGEAPGPAALTEALRRGIIGYDIEVGGLPSFIDGIAQGNLRDIWAPLYQSLSIQLPSWSDALDALLEGQLDEATSKSWYTRAGGDPEAFTWLFNTRGTAPTPDMLGVMGNRGIIPWEGTGPAATSFRQGFLEGPWRNKWEPAMRGLMAYHPPPRTTTALLRSGAISEAEALTLFKQQGLSPALAAAYVKDAAPHSHTTTKALTKADIDGLYASHTITEAQAIAMLVKLGLPASEAKLVTTQISLKRSIANTNNAITRIRTLLIGRKLDRGGAATALHDLGVAPAEASQLIGVWELERAATFRPLTAAQITSAWSKKIITEGEALTELQAIGYTPFDAWVILSEKNGSALTGRPPRGAGPT